ncbi:MAG: monovalent cation/H(+) antiporter subunit G [Symbiobacteriaceae bacterium]|nr:monovalent cation/H(+) antiporter subunit G [Symbiobacteriaceae bacterium]
MSYLVFALIALLLVAGLLVIAVAVVGLFRISYVLNRIHAAAKCDTFGMVLTFSALMFYYGFSAASWKLLLIIVFLWLSNPVSAHLIAHLEVASNPQVTSEYEVIHK